MGYTMVICSRAAAATQYNLTAKHLWLDKFMNHIISC